MDSQRRNKVRVQAMTSTTPIWFNIAAWRITIVGNPTVAKAFQIDGVSVGGGIIRLGGAGPENGRLVNTVFSGYFLGTAAFFIEEVNSNT